MSNSGSVKNFNPTKGFGFIVGADGADVFLHIKACSDGKVPQIGDTMMFDLEESKIKPGQMQACNASGGTGAKGGGKGQPGTGTMFGQCKSFNTEKGFGFIIGADGTDTFLHIKAMVDGSTPQQGDNLQFDLEPSRTKPDQMAAANVTGGTGWGGKGKGKDDGWGGGKGDAWGGKGKEGGWGGDSWGGKGDAGWGGKGDSWGGKGKGDGWGGDSWGGKGEGGYGAWGGKEGGWGGKDGGKGGPYGKDGGKGKDNGWGGKGW